MNTYFCSMELNERRRLKLIRLIEKRCNGVNANFARRINKDPTYINRLCYPPGKKGRKNIGDEIIEAAIEAFKLPHGWFDCELDAEIYEIRDPDLKALFDLMLKIPKEKRQATKRTLDLVNELSGGEITKEDNDTY